MEPWEGIVSRIGPRRILLALSLAFVAAGVIQVTLLAVSTPSIEAAVTDFVLIAGPGFALLYGVRRLPDSGIDPDSYPHVTRWVLGGTAVMVVALGLLVLNPEGEITRPVRAAAMAAGFGSIGGYLIGVNEARAVSRAREAERHNRELKRVRGQLEETVDRLAESNDQLEESNERLEQFAYAASHDLQEPLRMISSYLQLLESRHVDELDEDAREYIDFAVDGADRMRDMIEGLLEYSRVETEGESLHPVDLDDVIDGARDNLQLQIRESDADITVEDLPVVAGDPSQLRQVFQNLLANAIEYSGDERPRVHVSAERREGRSVGRESDALSSSASGPEDRSLDSVPRTSRETSDISRATSERSSAERSSADHSSGARRERSEGVNEANDLDDASGEAASSEGLDEASGEAVSGLGGGETASSETAEPSPGSREDGTAAKNDGAMWHVSVRDEGVGIDPAYQDRIFEVFQRLQDRTESDGTGIGLALCERIVDRHGGEIRVDSEPGEGATFTVSLPPANGARSETAR